MNMVRYMSMKLYLVIELSLRVKSIFCIGMKGYLRVSTVTHLSFLVIYIYNKIYLKHHIMIDVLNSLLLMFGLPQKFVVRSLIDFKIIIKTLYKLWKDRKSNNNTSKCGEASKCCRTCF